MDASGSRILIIEVRPGHNGDLPPGLRIAVPERDVTVQFGGTCIFKNPTGMGGFSHGVVVANLTMEGTMTGDDSREPTDNQKLAAGIGAVAGALLVAGAWAEWGWGAACMVAGVLLLAVVAVVAQP